MTLILAEASLDDGFIVADTLLTVVPSKYNTGPFNGKYHALKVHILSEKLCIALAGNCWPKPLFGFLKENIDSLNRIPILKISFSHSKIA